MFLCSSCVCVSLSLFCRFLGVPPGRGSCPLTGPLPFDLIYTDYHGLQQMKQHMGLSLKKHKLVNVYYVCVRGPVFLLCAYATLISYSFMSVCVSNYLGMQIIACVSGLIIASNKRRMLTSTSHSLIQLVNFTYPIKHSRTHIGIYCLPR